MEIRLEAEEDEASVALIIKAAFAQHPSSNQREHQLVDALRHAGALQLSLVALTEDCVVGHIAFSPVHIGGKDPGWRGLAPLAVLPSQQHRGIGTALVRAGLDRLHALGTRGCVVLGDPAFYRRFGFAARPSLRLAGVPATHFMALSLTEDWPDGEVEYHPIFAVWA